MSVRVTGKLPATSAQARAATLNKLWAGLNRLDPKSEPEVTTTDDHQVTLQAFTQVFGQPGYIIRWVERFEIEVGQIGLEPVVLTLSSQFEDAKLQEAWRNYGDDLSCLSYRKRRILEKRYSLNTDALPAGLDEIGRQFNVTRERIRQLAGEGADDLLKRASAEQS